VPAAALVVLQKLPLLENCKGTTLVQKKRKNRGGEKRPQFKLQTVHRATMRCSSVQLLDRVLAVLGQRVPDLVPEIPQIHVPEKGVILQDLARQLLGVDPTSAPPSWPRNARVLLHKLAKPARVPRKFQDGVEPQPAPTVPRLHKELLYQGHRNTMPTLWEMQRTKTLAFDLQRDSDDLFDVIKACLEDQKVQKRYRFKGALRSKAGVEKSKQRPIERLPNIYCWKPWLLGCNSGWDLDDRGLYHERKALARALKNECRGKSDSYLRMKKKR